VGECHQEICEAYAAICAFGGQEDFLVEDLKGAAAVADLRDGHGAKAFVQLC
jgi:hypothetical protein